MKRPPSCRVLIALIGAGTLARGARAAAPADDLPSVRLEWTAPGECIDGGELARAVSGQLGRPAFSPALDTELVVRGRIDRNDAGRHRAEVLLSTRAGEPLGARTLESDTRDCRSLDEATAVMLAIMLNVRRDDVAALARQATTPPASSSAWRVGAGAGLVVGLLPRAGVEAGVAAGFGGRLQPEIAAAFEGAGDAPAAEGRIRAGAVSFRLALAPILVGGPRGELRLRVSAGAGPMWASASGFAQDYIETRLYADGRAGLQVGVPIGGRLWAQVAAEAGWAPVRPSFAVRNGDGTTETLFRPSALLGTVVAGLSYRGR